MKLDQTSRGAIFDGLGTTLIPPRGDRPSCEPLNRTELEALRTASGKPVDDRDREHPMHRDLELRGYLRRIVSFDPARYAGAEPGPRFSWTRTEQAEDVLVRLDSWGTGASP